MAVDVEHARAPAKSGDRYPALDGLRALAVLSVVMTHIGFQTGATFTSPIGALLARLDFGVTVFFLLSGFLLYSPFIRADRLGKAAPDIATYLRNRALRVLPGYWVTVLVAVPVMASQFLQPGELVRQLLLLQVYSKGHLLPGLTQMWSLAVEVTFYLALPLLVVLARRLGVARLLVAMVFVAVGWTLMTRGLGIPDPGVGGLWLPAYLDWFALGMGLAALRAWHDTTGHGSVLDQLGDAGGTCWALAGLLLWLTATPLGGPRGLDPATTGQALTKHLLYGVAAAFLLVPAVFGTDLGSPVRRALEHPVARWLGRISYGVFLWHLIVLELVYRFSGLELFGGDAWLVTLVVLPLSVVVAAISLRLVEQPALDQKRRWTTAGR